ncbi:MAG: EamA family transporter [Alphaproteobacteria bacterium]|nr:EamA family transporter [Alphaproteobacteria bacterium]
MPLPTSTRQRLMFAFLCLTWGLNWVAMKIGVTAVPPGFFSGLRWTFAGAVLLAWQAMSADGLRVPWRLLPRLFWLSQILITFNVFVMLYGLRHVSSGLASVLSSALTPLALLGFAVMMGQERFNRRQFAAIGVGVAGLLLLYGPKLSEGRLDLMEGLGAIGIIIGNLCYCLGSVLSRPLMRSLPPAVLASTTNLLGGVSLLVVSIAAEPGVDAVITGNWGLEAWLAWLFMVFAGSLAATTMYFILVRDWGASRTGTYAFICPVISVAAGMAILGERVELIEAGGMVLMLVAAFMALRKV